MPAPAPTATASTIPTSLIPGYRGLSDGFLDSLEALALAPEGGWWRDVLAHRDLVLAVRAEYLNVYHRGAALFLIGQRQGRVVASTHAKYLVRQRQGAAELRADATFGLEADTAFWRRYEGPQTLDEMLRAAVTLAGPEKTGVHDLVLADPRVIDVEISLSGAPIGLPGDTGHAADAVVPGAAVNRQDRLDVAALTERDGAVFVTFHEAKHFTNKELRAASGRTPPVAEQIARYRATLIHHADKLAGSYQAVCRALVRLDRLRQMLSGTGAISRLDPLVSRVADASKPPGIDTEPRLVVFGFDEDQRQGAVWQGHKARLTNEFGLRVYAVGSTKGRSAAAFR